MQYYTKQQLQGAGAYGPRCRIGNWDEDLMAEETQFKDFLKAKDRGELKVRGRRGRGGTRGLPRAPGRGRPRSARQGPARGGPRPGAHSLRELTRFRSFPHVRRRRRRGRLTSSTGGSPPRCRASSSCSRSRMSTCTSATCSRCGRGSAHARRGERGRRWAPGQRPRTRAPGRGTEVPIDSTYSFSPRGRQVRSCAADVALSCECIDVDSNVTPDQRHDVTASGIVQPCMRNTFVLQKYIPKKPNVYDKELDGNTLHYGQKFYLIANPGLLGEAGGGASEPLHVQSEQVSTTSFASITREQSIYLSQISSYGGVWEVVTPDPMKRPASQYMPVLAGVPVIIRHCGTRKNLNCETATVRNDLGAEYEVTAHTVVSTTAQCGLEATKSGAPESTVEKMPLRQNVWRLINKIDKEE